MIKQRKTKYNWILYIIELVLLIAGLLIGYYAKKKLGVLRYLVYLNGKWETEFPIPYIKIFIILSLVIMLLISLLLILKNRNKINSLILLVLSTITLGYVFFLNTDLMKSYYISSLLYFIASCIQFGGLLYTLYRDKKC